MQGDQAEELPQAMPQPAKQGGVPPLVGFDLGGQGGQQGQPQSRAHGGQSTQLQEQNGGEDGVCAVGVAEGAFGASEHLPNDPNIEIIDEDGQKEQKIPGAVVQAV